MIPAGAAGLSKLGTCRGWRGRGNVATARVSTGVDRGGAAAMVRARRVTRGARECVRCGGREIDADESIAESSVELTR